MSDPVTPPPPSSPTPEKEAVERPILNVAVLIVSLLIAVIGAGFVLSLTGILNGRAGMNPEGWAALSSSGKLAATLGVPLSLLGVVLVSLGVAMAFTEWTGTFARTKETGVTQKGLGDVDKIVDAVGKLRGPALVLVTGALLLSGSAWIASNAAQPPPPATTSSE